MADEQQPTPRAEPPAQQGPQRIDPKELEGLSPAERAALYKARQRAAGVVPPKQGGPPAAAPPAKAPAPEPPDESPQPAQPAASSEPPAAPKPAGGLDLDPRQMMGLSPSERAAMYKARLRATGFVPPQRGQGAAVEAPAKPMPEAPPPPPRPAPPKPAAAAARAAAGPARPAEPEPDPPEIKRLRELVPELSWERVHGYVEVTLPADKLLPVARLAREALGFDYLSAVTAVDYSDHLLMVYHLYGFDYRAQPGCLVLQAKLPREASPSVDSLTALWPGAEFQEREVWDLMGIKFLGHPDLRRILLADDFPGHPLRKGFTFDYEYVLVRHLRYGADGQLATPYVPPHEQAAGAALTTPHLTPLPGGEGAGREQGR